MLTKLKNTLAQHKRLKKVLWFIGLYFIGLVGIGGAMWLSHFVVVALGWL